MKKLLISTLYAAAATSLMAQSAMASIAASGATTHVFSHTSSTSVELEPMHVAPLTVAVGGNRIERRQDVRQNRGERIDNKQDHREDRHDCRGDGANCRSDNRQDSRSERADHANDRVDDRQERR